jgi:hypothetical protein
MGQIDKMKKVFVIKALIVNTILLADIFETLRRMEIIL